MDPSFLLRLTCVFVIAVIFLRELDWIYQRTRRYGVANDTSVVWSMAKYGRETAGQATLAVGHDLHVRRRYKRTPVTAIQGILQYRVGYEKYNGTVTLYVGDEVKLICRVDIMSTFDSIAYTQLGRRNESNRNYGPTVLGPPSHGRYIGPPLHGRYIITAEYASPRIRIYSMVFYADLEDNDFSYGCNATYIEGVSTDMVYAPTRLLVEQAPPTTTSATIATAVTVAAVSTSSSGNPSSQPVPLTGSQDKEPAANKHLFIVAYAGGPVLLIGCACAVAVVMKRRAIAQRRSSASSQDTMFPEQPEHEADLPFTTSNPIASNGGEPGTQCSEHADEELESKLLPPPARPRYRYEEDLIFCKRDDSVRCQDNDSVKESKSDEHPDNTPVFVQAGPVDLCEVAEKSASEKTAVISPARRYLWTTPKMPELKQTAGKEFNQDNQNATVFTDPVATPAEDDYNNETYDDANQEFFSENRDGADMVSMYGVTTPLTDEYGNETNYAADSADPSPTLCTGVDPGTESVLHLQNASARYEPAVSLNYFQRGKAYIEATGDASEEGELYEEVPRTLAAVPIPDTSASFQHDDAAASRTDRARGNDKPQPPHCTGSLSLPKKLIRKVVGARGQPTATNSSPDGDTVGVDCCTDTDYACPVSVLSMVEEKPSDLSNLPEPRSEAENYADIPEAHTPVAEYADVTSPDVISPYAVSDSCLLYSPKGKS